VTDSQAKDSFDAGKLRQLEGPALSALRASCDNFNDRFNQKLMEEFRYQFKAGPLNFSDLDYDFYEFGGDGWYHDHGHGFTCAWGTILVESFGFRWETMSDVASLNSCVLRHEEASHLFFPWQFLWSLVESAGYQFNKAEGAWLLTLERVDRVYGLPDGWHPAIDALREVPSSIPPNVVSELRKLREQSEEDFFHVLGLEPYGWAEGTDWDSVAGHVRNLWEYP
jgi:hypothetical protein